MRCVRARSIRAFDGDELQIVERGIRAEGRAEGFTGGMWLGIIT